MSNLFLCRLFAFLEVCHDLKRCLQMFSGQRFIIFVCSNNLRYIVNVVSWRIRISLKSMQLFMLGHLSYETLQSGFFSWPDLSLLFIKALFVLLLFSLIFLFSLQFFLFFFLQVFLHFWDFRLQIIQLIVQFKILRISFFKSHVRLLGFTNTIIGSASAILAYASFHL